MDCPRRPDVWLVALVALGCSSSDDATTTVTASDVRDACNGACAKQTSCAPPAPPIDCTAICGGVATPDAGTRCDPALQKAEFDQCGQLECSHVASCVVDVSVCRIGTNGAGGANGGFPGTGGTPAGGVVGSGGAITGGSGTAGAGGTTASTGGANGAVCVACGGNANACCMALATRLGQDPTQCAGTTEATCRASSPSQQASFADECKSQLQSGAMLGIAACR